MIRYGPAGWEYPDWAGIVYPRPEARGFDRLAFLAGWFGTVEVNATFYRPFTAEVAARWCERVAAAPAFRFGAKVWRRFTHEREAYGAPEVAEARAALDRLHHYLYSADELRPWAGRIHELAASPIVEDVYVVTNNHFRGQAPANAKMLEALVEGHLVECPRELLAAYPEALRPFVVAEGEGAPAG